MYTAYNLPYDTNPHTYTRSSSSSSNRPETMNPARPKGYQRSTADFSSSSLSLRPRQLSRQLSYSDLIAVEQQGSQQLSSSSVRIKMSLKADVVTPMRPKYGIQTVITVLDPALLAPRHCNDAGRSQSISYGCQEMLEQWYEDCQVISRTLALRLQPSPGGCLDVVEFQRVQQPRLINSLQLRFHLTLLWSPYRTAVAELSTSLQMAYELPAPLPPRLTWDSPTDVQGYQAQDSSRNTSLLGRERHSRNNGRRDRT
jgi:hypothetical protein